MKLRIAKVIEENYYKQYIPNQVERIGKVKPILLSVF
jgi:hypothetical protein